ncbi:tRNA (adenosine(37)-N6)-threonylcarbamoyltransferase complex dimerization subunit type 1 TsaB [Labedella phragmitis]|uniref:tRNA (Adenosine(37)-N6)-threonylcarbamoyltransferase complex dimerization subunit type 1 TsaB n=1 Tax=Labedella phragmitis TaxID=2498849 RepID=A0A444PRV0_9MICO|nr:tRNA (adenosine(37)-N6)-threonylcarbamoyltransferase complex dimerization subunit type 1 TsaB [Labedella phragmitis]RWZ49954.1 tRNA (adenosine(37)-N6)-threonylcarbamoyltransferase complex dimerization subunit type 1 TsaB [Labedella phragmitis]
MILAIDSSIGTSVALCDPSGRLASARSEAGHLTHAEVVGALIGGVLEDAGVGPAEVSAVASGMGPGPFTGLRIGIAAARAFGVARRVPVVPVLSHDAIAAARLESPIAGELVVVTDARRREVAWTRYSGVDPSGPVRIGGPELAPRDVFEVLDAERLDAMDVPAEFVARLAALTLAGRRAGEADEPVYLRAPDVTLSSRKRVTP